MTLRNLWGKLRKRNKSDYRQFQFCTAFAVMLVSSFLILLFSPLIQGSLPDGGDSAKQIYMIFAISAVGCMIFVVYVTKLFLRYKSREIGIFLALGAEKRRLKNSLVEELALMTGIWSAAGIVLGAILAFISGNAMEKFVSDVYDGKFSFSAAGFLASACYAVLLFLVIQFQAYRAMKRTNVIEIINEQHRQEPMKKSVSSGYLASGIILLAAGIFFALILPRVAVYALGISLGSWPSLFYAAVLLGIYRILVYTVSSRKKGRRPQKYYNNLIDYGMMKFQGASVVRNMLVITLLLFGGLFAISFIPLNLSSGSQKYEDEYSYRYLTDADEPSETKIHDLAGKYNLSVTDYREASFLRIFGSGTNVDYDDQNKVVKDYYEKYALYDVTSASEYKKLTGKALDIPQGGYYQIIGDTSEENIWSSFGDMDQLYIESEADYLPMEYMGTVFSNSLTITSNGGMADAARFVVSDTDFTRLQNGLSEDRMEIQVLFSTEGETKNEIAFSNELFRTFALGMSDGMDVMDYYNEAEAQREGEEYIRTFTGAVVDPENPLRETDWKFTPLLTPIQDQQLLMMLATRVLMFSYIFVICLAAIGVIGFSRSQNVALTNQQIFEDIKRLGADTGYRKSLMKKQVRKIFVLPSILGSALSLAYLFLITWNNDGVVKADEIKFIFIMTAVAAACALYQYVIYRLSAAKASRILNL